MPTAGARTALPALPALTTPRETRTRVVPDTRSSPRPLSSGPCGAAGLRQIPDRADPGLPQGLPGARHSRTASSRAAPSSIPRPPGATGREANPLPDGVVGATAEQSRGEQHRAAPSRVESSRAEPS